MNGVVEAMRNATGAAALLAFDTATEHLAVALAVGEREWLHEAPGGAKASAALIPAIQSLLARAAIGIGQVDAIAFGRGPGAFTGLRTACAVAQGLAFGAARPVLALDTLMLVAEDARRCGGGDDVWAAMDARMGEIYAGHYRSENGNWKVQRAPALYTLEALQALWTLAPPTAVAGSALDAFAGRLAVGNARSLPQALPRASALLPMARAAWADGCAIDPAQALPLYLRDKVALTTAERQDVQAARLQSGTPA